MSKILTQMQRAAKIVKNLLAFAGPRRLDTTPVSLSAVVAQALEMKSNDLRIHDVEVRVEIEPCLPAISGDPFQLVEALLNVITNADQAMMGTARRGQLVVSARKVAS